MHDVAILVGGLKTGDAGLEPGGSSGGDGSADSSGGGSGGGMTMAKLTSEMREL